VHDAAILRHSCANMCDGPCKIMINALFNCHFRRMVAGQMGKLCLTYMDYRPNGGECTKVQCAADVDVAIMRAE
jgi:hypothetical protein